MKVSKILSITEGKTAKELLNREYTFPYKLRKIGNAYYICKQNGRKVYDKAIHEKSSLLKVVKQFLLLNSWFRKFSAKQRNAIIQRYVKALKEYIE